jgi:hypothetical protein
MAEIRTLGLASIEIGDPVDGGVATTFAALGVTYKDTATISEEDPAEAPHYSEENEDPEEILYRKGKKTIKWSIMDSSPATLAKILGGTTEGTAPNNTWDGPRALFNVEKSVKITPRSGHIIVFPRVKLSGKMNYKLARTGIFLVDITGTVLIPTDGETAPVSMYLD